MVIIVANGLLDEGKFCRILWMIVSVAKLKRGAGAVTVISCNSFDII